MERVGGRERKMLYSREAVISPAKSAIGYR